jgi:HEPN domain-containing protein
MLHLYSSKYYPWSLFVGHLVIEKLLKAYCAQKQGTDSPRIHDLLRLAQIAGLELSDERKDMLDTLTTFNISARYPDFKNAFRDRCTNEFTQARIKEIKELRRWLRESLTAG